MSALKASMPRTNNMGSLVHHPDHPTVCLTVATTLCLNHLLLPINVRVLHPGRAAFTGTRDMGMAIAVRVRVYLKACSAAFTGTLNP